MDADRLRVMSEPVRLLIHGASGRMGQTLLHLCRQDAAVDVVAAVSGQVRQRVIDGLPHFSAAELEAVPAFDVAVDFSLAEAFDAILAICTRRGAALVSGTTGLERAQCAALDAAGRQCPVLWAANFSLGVAVLTELVRKAAASLPDWDCDIVESHHANKQDAPSGTALALGEAAALASARPRYAALRAGDIVGEHLVQFTGSGERIELIHRAGDRNIFARGALTAAKWIVGKAPGSYRMTDLLAGR